jgi:hypothetical protein
VSSSAFCVAMALSSADAFDEDFFAAISEQVEKEMNAVVAPLPLLAKRSLSPPSTSAPRLPVKKRPVLKPRPLVNVPIQKRELKPRSLAECTWARQHTAVQRPVQGQVHQMSESVADRSRAAQGTAKLKAEHPDLQIWRSGYKAGLIQTRGPSLAADRSAAAWTSRQRARAAAAAARARRHHEERLSQAEVRARVPKTWLETQPPVVQPAQG